MESGEAFEKKKWAMNSAVRVRSWGRFPALLLLFLRLPKQTIDMLMVRMDVFLPKTKSGCWVAGHS